jgi:hypothetical protein
MSFISKHPPLKGVLGKEDFQLQAMKKCIEKNRVILDIMVRHGKTYIVCGMLYSMFEKKEVDAILIICRPEGMENFKIEILNLLSDYITEDDIVLITRENRDFKKYFTSKKVIITSYNTFRLSGAYYHRKEYKRTVQKPSLKAIDFSQWNTKRIMILDEAQSIHNYDSLQSHYCHLYKDFFEKRVIMSGTFGYKFFHYFSLIKFLLPSMLPYSFSQWLNYISKKGLRPSEKYKIENFLPDKVKEFKDHCIDKVQVSFKDCLPFTKNNEIPIYISMTEKMRTLYQKFIENEIKDILKDSLVIRANTMKGKFPYLVQITSDPSLIQEKFNIGNWKLEDNPKVEILESLLQKHCKEQNEKIIVWCKYPRLINPLVDYFSSYKPYKIHGNVKTSVKREDRIEELEDFKKSKTRNILFSNQVLSTSISITEATIQIFFDLPLDNDPFEQCKARITGPLQKKETMTYYLLFNNSMDIYIRENLLSTKQGVKDILSSKEELDLDDYKEIFNAKV